MGTLEKKETFVAALVPDCETACTLRSESPLSSWDDAADDTPESDPVLSSSEEIDGMFSSRSYLLLSQFWNIKIVVLSVLRENDTSCMAKFIATYWV